MSTTAPEYLTTLRDGFADAMQQWVDQSTTAWDQWSQAWSPAAAVVGVDHRRHVARVAGRPLQARRAGAAGAGTGQSGLGIRAARGG